MIENFQKKILAIVALIKNKGTFTKITSKNSPRWFPVPQNMGLDTKIKSLASSQAKLEIYTMKGSWTSYSR